MTLFCLFWVALFFCVAWLVVLGWAWALELSGWAEVVALTIGLGYLTGGFRVCLV